MAKTTNAVKPPATPVKPLANSSHDILENSFTAPANTANEADNSINDDPIASKRAPPPIRLKADTPAINITNPPATPVKPLAKSSHDIRDNPATANERTPIADANIRKKVPKDKRTPIPFSPLSLAKRYIAPTNSPMMTVIPTKPFSICSRFS